MSDQGVYRVVREGSDGCSVLVVDDEQALAQALVESLRQEPVVGRASAVDEPSVAVRLMEAERADVVVVALDSDVWDPVPFIRTIAAHLPPHVIVAMSGVDDVAQATAAVRAGAVSWVSKQAGVQEFAAVIRAAVRGEASVPPAMLMQVLRRLTADRGRGDRDSVAVRLSNRERQILEYTAQGLTRREIAARLQVSINTVRTHSQHMLSKLGVHTTLEAVMLALREEAVDDGDDAG
jgi:DNA-binding NarL/FixJ family response regulator